MFKPSSRIFDDLVRPLICPLILSSFFTLLACNQPIPKLSYRGLPQQPIPHSFKIQIKETGFDSPQNRDRLASTTQRIAGSFGCEMDQIAPIVWEEDRVSEALSSTFHVRLKSCDLTPERLEQVLLAFSDDESIAAVEAEAKVKTSFAENDPGKRAQEYLSAISRDKTCDALPSGSREIVVAVIDSGVQPDHPDLVANLKRDAQGQVVGANFVNKGSSIRPDSHWADQNGHGTHVAGIIAASANNMIGVSGVAACANVKIMPVRVLDASGTGSSIEIDRGIQWAIAKGAHIINLSLGSNVRYRSPRAAHPSALFEEAASRGVIVFAAAGNESLSLGHNQTSYVYSYPASYEHVLSVAALDNQGRLASFSNRGDTVDIAAPGVSILSTYMGSGYRRESGTSMASPVAAGALALALSASLPQERIGAADVESALTKAVSRHSLSATDVTSGGMIDVGLLATLLAPKAPSPLLSGKAPAKPEGPKQDAADSSEQAISPSH